MHQVCPASASKKPEFLTELPVAPSLAEGLAGEGQREESDLDSGRSRPFSDSDGKCGGHPALQLAGQGSAA